MRARVRLVVDAARCDGHGICALRCPDLVALDQWGFARVDGRDVVERVVVRRARRAVAACPAGALSLVRVPVVVPELPPGLRLVAGGRHDVVPATAVRTSPVHNLGCAGR